MTREHKCDYKKQINEELLDDAVADLISEIQIYEERQPNGQGLKSIKFKFPIFEEDRSLSLDNDSHVEYVCLLTRAGRQ